MNLDSYESELAQVLAPMPEERRLQVLAEVRSHVEAMIEARRADGQSETQATRAALRDFGTAAEIGSQLLEQWSHSPRMETRGTPLSKREKLLLLGRPLLVILIYYPLALWLLPLLRATPYYSLVMSVFLVGGFAFGIWRSQRERIGPMTPAQKALYGLLASQIAFGVLYFNRAALPFEIERLTTPLMYAYVPLVIACSVWYKRERKFNPPWRGLKNFDANPIATEERFRLSGLTGLIMGAAMGIMSTLWMSWQFFGIGWGLLMCIPLLGVYALLYRVVR